MMPCLDMFRTHMRVGAFSKVKIAGLLEEGELVGVAPGGGRECLFDSNCSVMWNNRTGFAKVAGLTQVPIIPVYGGFPVQLTTHVGNPIFVKEGESPLELQSRVRLEVKKMISHYQVEKDVLSALDERYS